MPSRYPGLMKQKHDVNENKPHSFPQDIIEIKIEKLKGKIYVTCWSGHITSSHIKFMNLRLKFANSPVPSLKS